MKYFLLLVIYLLYFTQSFAENSPVYKTLNLGVTFEQITAISQDEKGRLLLGTNKGIYSYNGLKTNQIAQNELKNKAIKTILKFNSSNYVVTETGEIWLLSKNKLALLKNASIEFVQLKISEKQIIAVYQKQFVLFNSNKSKIIKVPFANENASVLDVSSFQGNFFALLSTNELIDIKNKESRNAPLSVKFLGESKEGVLLFPEFINLSGFSIYKNGVFSSKTMLMPKQLKKIDRIHFTKGSYFASTKLGLLKIHPTEKHVWRWFETESISEIFIDKQNNKWLVSKGNQLLLVTKNRLKKYNSGIYNKSITIDFQHLLLISENKLSELNLYSGEVKLLRTGNFKNQIFSRIARTNYYLLDEGVYNWRSKKLIPWTNESFTNATFSNGTWYFSNDQGVKKLESVDFTEESELLLQNSTYQTSEFPIQQLESFDGTVYASSNGELLRLDQDSWKSIRIYNKKIEVQFIYSNGNSLLVVAATNKLYTVKGTQVVKEQTISLDGKALVIRSVNYSRFGTIFLTDNALIRLKSKSNEFEKVETNGIIPISVHDFGKRFVCLSNIGMYELNWEGIQSEFGTFSIQKPYLLNQKGEKVSKFSQLNGSILIPVEYLDLLGHSDHVFRYRIIADGAKGMWNTISTDIPEFRFDYLAAGNYKIEVQLFDRVSGIYSATKMVSFGVSGPWLKPREMLWFFLGMALTIFTIRVMRARRNTQI